MNFTEFRPLTKQEHDGYLGLENVAEARIASAATHEDGCAVHVDIVVEPLTVQVHVYHGDANRDSLSYGLYFYGRVLQEARVAFVVADAVRARLMQPAGDDKNYWDVLGTECGLEDLS